MLTLVTRKMTLYADLVKFEHTVFALPFALSATLLACPPGHWPAWTTLLWVIAAMVGGRTFAMGMNRIIDARIDAANPRTAGRAIPAGRVRLGEAWCLTLAALALMIIATAQLPRLCLELLPIALVILVAYSYVKRFSNLAHLVLGLAFTAATVGGWIAVTGQLSLAAIAFGLAMLFWVTGFDLIYACQDVDFDRSYGLHSIPAALGIARGLTISRVCHALTFVLLVAVGLLVPVQGFYWLAVLLAAAMLVYEQSLVSANRLDRVNEAFFMVNGVISIAFFVLVVLDKCFPWRLG